MRLRLLICAAAVACSPIWAGWESIGPFGGSAAIIQVDRHHRGTVFATTSNAQVFRSDDDGDSWRAVPFPAELRATLHAFVVDPRTPDVYLAGLASDSPEYSGILRTIDGGLTWTRIPGPTSVWSIAIWPMDSRVIAAGTLDGVFLTRDGGEKWEQVAALDNPDLKPVVSLSFDPADARVVYAGTPHLPWKTVDGGATWRPIHEGMQNDSDVFSILVDDRLRRRLFASTCGGIYRSLNNGETWSRITGATNAADRTYQIAQSPLRPNVMLAGTALGLAKSVDGGTTWRRLTTQSTRWIAFDPVRPDRIFVATDEAGLFRSDDLGDSLRKINRGFCNRRVDTLTAAGNILYVTVQGYAGSLILRRSDSAETWEAMPGLVQNAQRQGLLSGMDQTEIHGLVTTEDNGWLAATPRGLMKSDDMGLTWQPVSGALQNSTVRAICKHPTRAGLLFASQYGAVFSSTDDGRTWKPLTSAEQSAEALIALLVLPGDPDRLFALTQSRGVVAIPLPSERSPQW